jgi:hypothetical protein
VEMLDFRCVSNVFLLAMELWSADIISVLFWMLAGSDIIFHRMNPCTLGWYLPLLVKDVPGALQPSEGTSGGKSEKAFVPQGWQELDSKFRRDLPDEAYIGRLAYRGLIMQACPRIRMLDGVGVSEKERMKAHHLLQGILRKGKMRVGGGT